MTDLLERTRAWIEADPDPATRAELEHIVDSGDTAELASRMDAVLEFGTAGIRGEVGAGPGRMNRAVVIRTTLGLARYLQNSKRGGGAPVVIGFDARPDSRQFAEDAAGVLAAADIQVLFFPGVTPTPLVAYAAKHLSASAAVVVTASHNPPADNGYKVYGHDAAQIVSPTDFAIQEEIASTPPAADIPRLREAFSSGSPLVKEVSPHILDRYWDEVSAQRSRDQGSSLDIVYTPLHGVAGETLLEVMRRAGHQGIRAVPEQAEPDGSFPTVDFPNPEEPGVLDLAVAMARSDRADLVLANDPDGDRLAVVVPEAGGWRTLSGNEVGVLLADYMLANDPDPTSTIVASSIVSSPMIAQIADEYGARHESTLTGFKWIVRAGLAVEAETGNRFIFGFEEALGYTVGSTVRDKDGISAALMFSDLVADCNDGGQSILDRLVELWSRHGIWASAQTAITQRGPEGLDVMRQAIERLGNEPPDEIDFVTVTSVTDYRQGAEERPAWLGQQSLIELALGDRGRVLARPSGTEPKLKVYVDLREDVGSDPMVQSADLTERARRLGEALAAILDL